MAMSCKQIQGLIHAHIDGELDLLKNMEIEAHLDECELCQPEHQDQLDLRTVLQAGAQYFSAPEILKKRAKEANRRLNRNTSCI